MTRTYSLLICHHQANFGGHKHGCNRKMFLICYVILQDHVIVVEGWRDFKVESPSSYIKTLPNLMAIGLMVVEIYF